MMKAMDVIHQEMHMDALFRIKIFLNLTEPLNSNLWGLHQTLLIAYLKCFLFVFPKVGLLGLCGVYVMCEICKTELLVEIRSLAGQQFLEFMSCHRIYVDTHIDYNLNKLFKYKHMS